MLLIALAVRDGLVCNAIKHAVGRERPFLVLPEVLCRVGQSGSGSLPSSHAANWFAATMALLVYYRRSLWVMLPLAVMVSFSRVYNGVHYPGDVLAGAILGGGLAVVTMWALSALWQWAGRKWFPLWWEALPSLVAPPTEKVRDRRERRRRIARPTLCVLRVSAVKTALRTRTTDAEIRGLAPVGFRVPQVTLDIHWVRLGYVFIAVLLLARLAYIASGTIQLAEDEAYQWLWSKHLALSYYSKPPLIAYTQFLGTALWGDTAVGVRFFSPVIAALLSLVVLRFFAREVNARAGFFLLLIFSATPLAAVGSVMLTVDPLSVLFWTAAMLAGWRAIQEDSTTKDWFWVGLWMGLGFLSKYTELLQWLCWVVFFALWPPARKQLRRPGPYVALLTNLVCALPVLIWNYQRHWVTVAHVAEDAGANQAWHPTLRYAGDFIGVEAGLLNPVFFVGAIWAAIAFWRRHRHHPHLVYFFSMGAPLFLAYFLHSFRSRVLPNWIAPSVLPLFCMMVIYWDARWRFGVRRVKTWLKSGLVLGFATVVLFHQTDLWSTSFGTRRALAACWHLEPTGKTARLLTDLLTERYLPVRLDPLHRVRQWNETARIVGQARQELLAEGKPVFIITDHYGMAGQISFYLPEARARVRDTPLVYCRVGPVPDNQFFFWPSYGERKGENAIFVRELDRYNPEPLPAPPQLEKEFESVTDLGVRNVMYHDRFLLRPLQVFACRGLK